MHGYTVLAPFHIAPAETESGPPLFFLTSGERSFYVGEITALVLEALRQGDTLPAIRERMRAALGGREPPGLEAIEGLIRDRLVPTGLVGTGGDALPAPAAAPSRASYIRASATLLPPRAVELLAGWLAPLFAPRAAGPLLLAVLALHVAFFARPDGGLSPATVARAAEGLPPRGYLAAYLVVAVGFLLHELGHAAAARRYGIRLGRIGVGIYLIFPVLFANVSESWRLGRGKRIVINLGGIYFQLLLNGLCIAAMLLLDAPGVGRVVVLNLLSILHALNPLFRFDGYWVYSDHFGLTNLRQRSLTHLGELARRLVRGGREGRAQLPRFLAQDWPLTLYTVLCTAFFAYFGYLVASLSAVLYRELPVLVPSIARQAARVSSLSALLELLPRLLALLVQLVIVSSLLNWALTLLRRLAPWRWIRRRAASPPPEREIVSA